MATPLPDPRDIEKPLAPISSDKYDAESSQDQLISNTAEDIQRRARSMPALANQVDADVINIITDYDWTLSINRGAVEDQVPFIKLTEFKLTASNVVNSLQSTLMAIHDLAAENSRSLNAIATSVFSPGTAGTDKLPPELQYIKDEIDGKATTFMGTGMTKTALQNASNILNNISSNLARNSSPQFEKGGQDLSRLYDGLYSRKKTGREYIIPYFTEEFVSITNTFQDSYDTSSAVESFASSTIEILEKGFTALPAITEPGVYVQRPKFYNFKSDAPPITVTFNLFNTITPMEHLRNSEFIQKLALSNLPRRYSKAVVEPPCIYELDIPGKAFYPYCYIRTLKVNHAGTKRVIQGEIIPDAYSVTIEIVPLTTDVSNFYDIEMRRSGIDFTRASYTPPSDTSKPTVGSTQIQRNAVRQAQPVTYYDQPQSPTYYDQPQPPTPSGQIVRTGGVIEG